MAKLIQAVTLNNCVEWIVENTDIDWATSFDPVLPAEAQMCAHLFGLSKLYFAGLLLDKRLGKERDEFTRPVLK